MNIENMPREELRKLQEKRLKETMRRAFRTPFYKKRYKELGLSEDDVKNYDDLVKLPFISKSDIVSSPSDFIFERPSVFHTTSGTTGSPTIVGFTKNDHMIQVEMEERNIRSAGFNKEDIVDNTTPYGMFFAGIMLHEAVMNMGATVIPTGKLSSAKQQVEIMDDFKCTAIIGVSQYILKLSYVYEEEIGDPRESRLKKAYVLGEPLTDSVRRRLEERWDIDVRQGYGLSEAGSGAECGEKNGIHWPEDKVLVEVIDSETGERLGENEDGELVYTTISRTGTLVIRFRSRDISRVSYAGCPCGRTLLKLGPVYRNDELMKIKGTLISPNAIDEAIFNYDDIQNYLFVVEKDENEAADLVKLYLESEKKNSKVLMELSKKFGGKLWISPDKSIYVPKGSIPQLGRKEKRFIDLRKKNQYEMEVREFMKRMDSG